MTTVNWESRALNASKGMMDAMRDKAQVERDIRAVLKSTLSDSAKLHDIELIVGRSSRRKRSAA